MLLHVRHAHTYFATLHIVHGRLMIWFWDCNCPCRRQASFGRREGCRSSGRYCCCVLHIPNARGTCHHHHRITCQATGERCCDKCANACCDPFAALITLPQLLPTASRRCCRASRPSDPKPSKDAQSRTIRANLPEQSCGKFTHTWSCSMATSSHVQARFLTLTSCKIGI